MRHMGRMASLFLFLAMLSAVAVPSSAGSVEKIGLGGFSQALIEARSHAQQGQAAAEEAALHRALSSLSRLERHPVNALLNQDFSGLLDRHRFGRAHRLGTTCIDTMYGELTTDDRVTKGGLYEHLDEAIKSHEQRLPVYAQLTKGLATPLFRKIATLQKLNLPIAWYIDLRARRFQKQGIPIITGDLVSMSSINPIDTPPRHRGQIPADLLEELRGRMKTYQKAMMLDLRENRFLFIASRTADLLRSVQAVEIREDCHMAMTCHMLESLGITALHGDRWLKLSKGATAGLTKLFLTIQAFPMQECLKTDRKAQDVHALGIGVIVNDVPHIPFLEEWEATKRPLR